MLGAWWGGNRLVEQVWVLISGPLTWILAVKAPSSTSLTRAPESALHRDGTHQVCVGDGPPDQLAAFPSGIWDIKKEVFEVFFFLPGICHQGQVSKVTGN